MKISKEEGKICVMLILLVVLIITMLFRLQKIENKLDELKTDLLIHEVQSEIKMNKINKRLSKRNITIPSNLIKS